MATTKILIQAWRENNNQAFISVTTPIGVPYELDSIGIVGNPILKVGSSRSYTTSTHAITQVVQREGLYSLIYLASDGFQPVPLKIIVKNDVGATLSYVEWVNIPGSNGSLHESFGPASSVLNNIAPYVNNNSSPYCGNMGNFPTNPTTLTSYTTGVSYNIAGAANQSDSSTWYRHLAGDSIAVLQPVAKYFLGHPTLRGLADFEFVTTSLTAEVDRTYEWLTVSHAYNNGDNLLWWGGPSAVLYPANSSHTYNDIYNDITNVGPLSVGAAPFVLYGKFIAKSINFNNSCIVTPTTYTYNVCANTDSIDCQGNTIPTTHRAPSGAEYVAGNVTFTSNICCPVSCADFSLSTSTTPKNGWSNSGSITITPTGGTAPYTYAINPAAPLQINPSPTQDDTTCDTTIGSNLITCDTNNVIAPGMNISGAGIPANAWVFWVDTPGAVTQFSMATGIVSFPTMALATATATDITATFTTGAFHVFGGLAATTHTATSFDANSPGCGAAATVTVPATTYTQGCTNATAQDYNATATVDCNGDIIEDPEYTQADGWDSCCIAQVSGCTDPNAINYNVDATLDDGSCTYPTPGCTDPTATNYLATADIDDGSCVYPAASCIPTSINSLISKTGQCLDYRGDKALIQIQVGLIDDCSTKTTWTLILIHYLLSKIGLPCIYNCQDYETQDPTTNNIYTADYLENFINFVNKNCDSCFGTNDNNAGPPTKRRRGEDTILVSGITVGGNTITINGITYNI